MTPSTRTRRPSPSLTILEIPSATLWTSALYDPVVDNQITLIEVGNGEGAIGSSGYFPSYGYYTRALDKGWHVAPTNNQDNHKGNWGDSNTARSVVLATDLSEEAIYDAMKNYRVYATEDNDLSILYSLNGNAMGSILDDQDEVDIPGLHHRPHRYRWHHQGGGHCQRRPDPGGADL